MRDVEEALALFDQLTEEGRREALSRLREIAENERGAA